MKRLSLAVILSALLTACGGSGGGGGESSNKDFFSEWTAVDNSLYFDFTGGQFNITYNNFLFVFTDGAVCSCDIEAQGDQSGGNIYVSSCFYAGGGSDPNCSASLENGGDPYPYFKSGATLTMCLDVGVGCLNYR